MYLSTHVRDLRYISYKTPYLISYLFILHISWNQNCRSKHLFSKSRLWSCNLRSVGYLYMYINYQFYCWDKFIHSTFDPSPATRVLLIFFHVINLYVGDICFLIKSEIMTVYLYVLFLLIFFFKLPVLVLQKYSLSFYCSKVVSKPYFICSGKHGFLAPSRGLGGCFFRKSHSWFLFFEVSLVLHLYNCFCWSNKYLW